MRNLISLFRLQVLAITLLTAAPTVAQNTITSEGREFWFGFMPNYITPANGITVTVATKEANRITLHVPGQFPIVREIPANSKTVFQLPANTSETRSYETPEDRAIRVVASNPCTVYGMSQSDLTADGFIALPVEALGTEHYVASYYDDAFAPGIDRLGGEFLIVAPHDGTQVIITTTANTAITEDGRTVGHTAGSTWTVNLESGQTYLVQSTGIEYGVDDLTGTHITSSKPIALMTGHQRAEIELEDGASKNHLLEMMPAVEHWGTEYYGIPHANHKIAGNFYRIISAEDDNKIETSTGSTYTVQKGEYVSISQAAQPMRFLSTNNKKFIVAEYAYEETHFGDQGVGDPFLIILNPVSGYVASADITIPSNGQNAMINRVTVVTSASAIGSLAMSRSGGAPEAVAASGTPIPNTSMAYVSIPVTADDSHWNITCDAPMGITVYGYASVDGYGYPGPRSFVQTARVDAQDAAVPLPLYPNPAGSAITIELGNEKIQNAWLIDLLGNRSPISFDHQGTSATASLIDVPLGVYTLLVETTTRSLIERVVIDR